MYHKVAEVKANDNYTLIVKFDNLVTKQYDAGKLLSDTRFESLKDKALFKTVKVDAGGYGIIWNDDIDISENEIWTEGEEVYNS